MEKVAQNDDRYSGSHFIIQEQAIWAAQVLSLDPKPVALDFDPPQTFIDTLKATACLDAYYSLRQARRYLYDYFTNSYNQTKNYLSGSIGIKQGVTLPDLKPMTAHFSKYEDQSENWDKIDEDLITYLRRSRARQRRRIKK